MATRTSKIELPEREILDVFSVLDVNNRAQREEKVKKLLDYLKTTSKKDVLLKYYLRRTSRGLCTKDLNRRHSYTLFLTELLKLNEIIISPETVYDSLETFAAIASENEKNQVLLGRITFLVVISRSGRFQHLSEDSVLTIIQDIKAGFDKDWIQEYNYLALSNVLEESSKTDFQTFKSISAKILDFPEDLNSWHIGLACRFFLVCRANGWQSDKIKSLKAVKRLFKRKNQDKLMTTMKDCFSRNTQHLPDCYIDMMKWLIKAPEGWILAKENCLKQLAESPKQHFKFEGAGVLLGQVDNNCPYASGSDIWDAEWTPKLNQMKNATNFKKLPEFLKNLKQAITKGRESFVTSLISTLITSGMNASLWKEISESIQSRSDLDLTKEITSLMKVKDEGLDVIDWQKACTSLNRFMQIPFLRKSHGVQVLEFFIRFGCFKTKADRTDYEIQNMISQQVISFLLRDGMKGEQCDWEKAVINTLAKANTLSSVHILVPTHVFQVYTLYQSCEARIKECERLSKEQRECLLSLAQSFMVLAYTHLHELLFFSLQDFTLALQDLSDPDSWTECVEAVIHILFAVQHSETTLLRDLAKRVYTVFAKDISADCLQVVFAMILPQEKSNEAEEEKKPEENAKEQEVKYLSDEEDKEAKKSEQKKEKAVAMEEGKEEEEIEDEVIDFTRLTTVLMEETDIDLALARAVKTQIDTKRKLRNPSDYWVRLLDLVEIILSKNSTHGGIVAIIPSLIEIIRQRQESKAWHTLSARCRKLLLKISQFKKLGTEGLDKSLVMAIIEDAVKLVNRDTKELEMLGKVLRLLNRCFHACPEMLDITTEDEAKEWLENNIEGNKPNLVQFWCSEIDLFLGRKRRNLQGVFYERAVAGADNLGWQCVGHSLSKITPDVRPRFQFDCFEWFHHSMNRLGKCPDEELKKFVPSLLQALPQVYTNMKNKKWKRKITKTVGRFIDMHSEKLTELGLWGGFEALKDIGACVQLYDNDLKRNVEAAKLVEGGAPKKKRKLEKENPKEMLKEKKLEKLGLQKRKKVKSGAKASPKKTKAKATKGKNQSKKRKSSVNKRKAKKQRSKAKS